MLAITIGFKGHHKTAECQALYTGRDAEEALRVAKDPGPGFTICHVFTNPSPRKRCPQPGAAPETEIVVPEVQAEVIPPAPVAEVETPAAPRQKK